MKTLFSHQDPMQKLVYTNEDIGKTLETIYKGVSVAPSLFVSQLKNILPSIKNVLGFTGDSIQLPEAKLLDKNQVKFLNIVSKIPYSELKEIKAFKPEGLIVTYLEFIDKLEEQVQRAVDTQKQTVEPYATFLGQLVSDGKIVSSLDTNEGTYKKLEASREKMYSDISKCYKQDSSESITTVGKVIDRNNDWSVVFSKLNKLLQEVNKIDRKDLETQINNCGEYLDIIIQNVDSGEIKELTPEVLRRLTNSTYQIAKEIEFVVAVYFRVLTLKGSIENTIDQVEKVYS